MELPLSLLNKKFKKETVVETEFSFLEIEGLKLKLVNTIRRFPFRKSNKII